MDSHPPVRNFRTRRDALAGYKRVAVRCTTFAPLARSRRVAYRGGHQPEGPCCPTLVSQLHRLWDLGGHWFECLVFPLSMLWHSLIYGTDVGPAACGALAGIRADLVRGTGLLPF